MPCSSDHFIPILDEVRARVEAENQPPVRKHPNWGGRRPGAGPPKGNLNAFKHGRTSRRQAELLEAIARMPDARQALIDIAKRNRARQKQAEEGMGVLLTRLLERTAAMALTQAAAGENDQLDHQDQNHQACPEPGRRGGPEGQREFLDFLNDVTAQMRTILEKPPRLRRTTIKPPPTGGAGASG